TISRAASSRRTPRTRRAERAMVEDRRDVIAAGCSDSSMGSSDSETDMGTPSKNTRSIVFDGICTMAMNPFVAAPFLSAFALALGASHWEIGLISAIAFLSMPMQLVGLYAVDRWKQRRRLVVVCALTVRLLWILVVCLPFLPEKDSVRFLLAVLVCIGLIAAITCPAWHSLVLPYLPPHSLGNVY